MTRARAFVAWLRTARGIGATLTFALLFTVGFVPLFGAPGYEHSVASGLLVPTIVAIVAAAEGFRDRHAVSPFAPLASVVRGLQTGLLFAAIALLAAFLHAPFEGFCDPLSGVATFALTAATGCLLSGAAGATVSIAVAHAFAPSRRRRRIATLVAGLVPLSTALVALLLFYFTPAVFAFDPFVGFFSGTLYDEVVDAWRPLLTYRAGTALTLLAIASAAAAVARDEEGRLRVERRQVAALSLMFALGSATLVAYGPELGHRSTAASIRRTLGGARSGPRCDVIFPRGTPEREADLLLRDCEEALVAVERRLGLQGPPRITAFFFRDAEQKRALMGAADTYVAKPWRREVYLQVAAYPHPVLGHEIAHVVAGSAARGPFKIAGSFFGLLPNPGLIEGIAVAASPDRDELTPAQWAHAMKKLGILPRLSKTFGGGFLAQNSAMAYTVAGAFVSHLYAQGKGPGVLAWYGGATFEQAFGRSFADEEAAFRASLDAVPLPDEALAVAKGRFDRPAIWGRRCPHVVERLRDEADECRERGELAEADAKLAALLSLDEVDPSARLDRAKLAAERGDEATMRALLEALVDDARVSTTWRNRAREVLGDDALRHGRLDEARARYDAARKEVLDEDWGRNLDVKSFATTSELRARLFGRLLVGRPKKRESKDEAFAATIAIARALERNEGTAEDLALARYLVARRLVEAHAHEEAEALLAGLDRDALGRITPRLVREAARLSVTIACLSEPSTRASKVASAIASYRAAPPANLGRREAIERLAERCTP